MKLKSSFIVMAVLLILFPVASLAANRSASSTPAMHEDFFIISSVNLPHHQIVLEEPTEVTELVQVNDNTVVLNEEGKSMELKDLRAGDTVFVTLTKRSSDIPIVSRIRKGQMTLQELHKRYLNFK